MVSGGSSAANAFYHNVIVISMYAVPVYLVNVCWADSRVHLLCALVFVSFSEYFFSVVECSRRTFLVHASWVTVCFITTWTFRRRCQPCWFWSLLVRTLMLYTMLLGSWTLHQLILTLMFLLQLVWRLVRLITRNLWCLIYVMMHGRHNFYMMLIEL